MNLRKGYLRIALILVTPWMGYWFYHASLPVFGALRHELAAREIDRLIVPIAAKDDWTERTGYESAQMMKLEKDAETLRFLRNQTLPDALPSIGLALALPLFLFLGSILARWVMRGFRDRS